MPVPELMKNAEERTMVVWGPTEWRALLESESDLKVQ